MPASVGITNPVLTAGPASKLSGVFPPTGFTVWIRVDALPGVGQIVYRRNPADELYLQVRPGAYAFGRRSASGTVEAVCPMPASDLGRWVHLAGVGGRDWTIYRNGELAGTAPGPAAVPSSDTLTIGANASGQERFAGTISHLMWWFGDLNYPALIKQAHAAPDSFTPATAGLLCFWPFDEGDGLVAHDRARAMGEPVDISFNPWAAQPPLPVWTQLTADGGFARRRRPALQVHRNALWLFAGGNSGPGTGDDVYTSDDGRTWRQAKLHAGWAGRNDQGSAVFRDKLWLLPGQGANDIWSSPDGANWTQVPQTRPFSARTFYGTVVFNDRLWVLGGLLANARFTDEIWSSGDGADWRLEQAGPRWLERGSMATAVFRGRIYVVGGDNSGSLADCWSSPDGLRWERLTPQPGWSPRMHADLVVVGDAMYLVGGDAAAVIQDYWVTRDGTNWTLCSRDLPGARQYSSAVAMGTRIISAGGLTKQGASDPSVWAYEGTG